MNRHSCYYLAKRISSNVGYFPNVKRSNLAVAMKLHEGILGIRNIPTVFLFNERFSDKKMGQLF